MCICACWISMILLQKKMHAKQVHRLHRREKKKPTLVFISTFAILLFFGCFYSSISVFFFIIRFRSLFLCLSLCIASVNSYICPKGNDGLALKIKPDIFCIYWLELLKFYPVFGVNIKRAKEKNILNHWQLWNYRQGHRKNERFVNRDSESNKQQ